MNVSPGTAVVVPRAAWLVALSLGLTACSLPYIPYLTPPSPAAIARLADGNGRPVGQAVLVQHGGDVRILMDVTGLAPGDKAVHIHQTGRCDPPSFSSAGGHFNPAQAEHGTANPRGPHAGDLSDITVDATGRGHLELTADRVALKKGATSLLDADGSAIVVHERPDDRRTDPDGASGARIACGVVVPAGRY
jgi:Cu-Zn family superoxide dismutase